MAYGDEYGKKGKKDKYGNVSFDKALEEYKKAPAEEDFGRFPRPEREEPYVEKAPGRIRVVSKQATPRFDVEEIEPLRRLSPEIIGSLFDRVRFLQERITEIKDAMNTRKNLHKEIMNEIDIDTKEKESLVRGLTDMDEIRNFKMDISMLRKEKRHECVQFWRDMFEISTELRQLMEEFEVETKILGIFEHLQEAKDKTNEIKTENNNMTKG